MAAWLASAPGLLAAAGATSEGPSCNPPCHAVRIGRGAGVPVLLSRPTTPAPACQSTGPRREIWTGRAGTCSTVRRVAAARVTRGKEVSGGGRHLGRHDPSLHSPRTEGGKLPRASRGVLGDMVALRTARGVGDDRPRRRQMATALNGHRGAHPGRMLSRRAVRADSPGSCTTCESATRREPCAAGVRASPVRCPRATPERTVAALWRRGRTSSACPSAPGGDRAVPHGERGG